MDVTSLTPTTTGPAWQVGGFTRYGVPHDEFTHGNRSGRHGNPGQCVCRPCRELNAQHLDGDARVAALTANGSAWHPEFPDAPQLR